MAWLLVRNTDSNSLPTVETWRRILNERLIPEAESFMTENPYTEEQYTLYDRHKTYLSAKYKILNAAKLSTEEITKSEQIVAEHEASMPTQQDLLLSKQLNDRTIDPVHNNSKRDLWRYYNHILTRERLKDDFVKQIELDFSRERQSKAWDVIDVYPDEKIVTNPPVHTFWSLLKVNGLSVEEAREFTKPYTIEINPGEEVIIRKKKYSVRIDLMPKDMVDKLTQDRFLEIDWKIMQDFILPKQTGFE